MFSLPRDSPRHLADIYNRPFLCFSDRHWSISTMTGLMREVKDLRVSLTFFPDPKQCCKHSIPPPWNPPVKLPGFWNGCSTRVFFVSSPCKLLWSWRTMLINVLSSDSFLFRCQLRIYCRHCLVSYQATTNVHVSWTGSVVIHRR